MAVYYIDPAAGLDTNDGLSPDAPRKDYTKLALRAGDSVLFKRGSFCREQLVMTEGEDGLPILYGDYGTGPLPTFCGSVDVSDPACWEPAGRENVWLCRAPIPTEVGNFVFGERECTAALRWDLEDLAAQGDFFDSRFGECNRNGNRTVSPQEILMYSVGNPGEVDPHMEAVQYGRRCLGVMRSNTVIENLRFVGGGVHGLAASGHTRNVTVRGCTFENIGGCCWSRDLRIRFGNGIEFWIGAENILIENNTFLNIYDSCATHQGPDNETPPARNFHVRNNVFDTYSMAAFEYRAQMMVDSSFTGNLCKNAGCGFGMLGETLPRRSEIWPKPMGHHIFLWRIPAAVEGGSILIADNTFVHAPAGAAVYSLIAPEAEAQITFQNNRYEGEYLMKAFFGGESTELS